MNDTLERPLVLPNTEPRVFPVSHEERRTDVDQKQAWVADVLQSAGREGLLVLRPENFAWLTSCAAPMSGIDPTTAPALYYTPEQRWLLASNVDAQRLFDDEIPELGYQLKEWPWTAGRTEFMHHFCHGRSLAADLPMADTKLVGEEFRHARRTLSPYEQSRMRALGQALGHALEATCRTLAQEQTEQEIAGQLSHRLIHRGLRPIVIHVAADGRSRHYRQAHYTDKVIQRLCVVSATASQYGLHASATRAVCFGALDSELAQEFDAACKITAAYAAETKPHAIPRDVMHSVRRVYAVCGCEHEWRSCLQGNITGRCAVESALLPSSLEIFQEGWAITWNAAVGAAISTDTFLVSAQGRADLVTLSEEWPLRVVRVQGNDILRPYILVR